MSKKQNKPGKTRVVVDGLSLKIDIAALDDIDTIEQLANVTDGTDPFAIVKVMKQTLGETGYQRVKTHCKNKETGRTSATAMSEFFAKVMQQAAPN